MDHTNSYIRMKEYFANLVEQHTSIKEFIGYFSRELSIKDARRDGIASPYLALFKYEMGFEGQQMNSTAVRKLGFAVMFNGIASDKYEEQYNAIDKAEQLALSVLARINFNSNDRNHFLYNAFIKESVKILPVELSTRSFGVEVYFSLKNPQSLKLNPKDYEDIEAVC